MTIEDFKQASWSFCTVPTCGRNFPAPMCGIRVSDLSPDSSFSWPSRASSIRCCYSSSVFMPVCLSVDPSICLCLSVYLSLFICIYLSVCLSVRLPACLPACLSIYLSLSLSICTYMHLCVFVTSVTTVYFILGLVTFSQYRLISVTVDAV